uniref:BED-type domain-containing protein n=1 Tax=Chenopodium quinoa TaxID=63459 RepID=A0A803MRD6_CHEQI
MIGHFLTRGLVMIFGYAYPAYECYKTVEKNKPEIEQLRFWCQYWILVALMTVFERVSDTFISWLPMYSEAKLAFIIYLWYPRTKGTTYVYDSFFKPYVSKHETEIDRNLLELRIRAGDMTYTYCQKAMSYGQTRIFEILQYVAAQSTPNRRPTQPQQPAPRPRPPAVNGTAPPRQPSTKPQTTTQTQDEEPMSPTSKGTEDECTPEEEANVRTQEEEASDPELIVENNNVSTMESSFQAVEKKRSLVWPKFLTFDKTKSTNGKQRSICKHCQKASFISNPHFGTQNIQRHLRKCSAYEKYLKNQGGNGSNKGKIFNQIVYRNLVAKVIIKHGNTTKADCLKMHKTLKARLKENLVKSLVVSQSHVIYVDSCQTEGYLCLTIHYVDDNWKLISILLNFTHIDSPHTGKPMYAAVQSMLQIGWDVLEKIRDVLEPFYETTKMFSGRLEHDDDDVLRTMAIEMKSKFDKYWFNLEQDDYGMLFAFAMILDSCCKLSVLKFCYEDIFGDVEATLRVSDLHLKLEKFYKLYAQIGTSSTLNNNTDMAHASHSRASINSTSTRNRKRKFDYFAEYDDKEASSSFDERSILDVYLEDPKLDRKAELDILAFWKENEHRYKGRSHLARDILAVPLTTLASESTSVLGVEY